HTTHDNSLSRGSSLEPTTAGRGIRYPYDTTLADGTAVCIRPIRADDKGRLQSMLKRMSLDTRYRRFMSPLPELSSERLHYLTEIDYSNHYALLALVQDQDSSQAIAVGRYIRDPNNPEIAEPAFTVVDAYQGRGLGSLLLQQLMARAATQGIERFCASLLAENMAMKALFAKHGATFKHEGHSTLSAEFAVQAQPKRAAAKHAGD